MGLNDIKNHTKNDNDFFVKPMPIAYQNTVAKKFMISELQRSGFS
jgi:hypothetical protein